MKNINTIKECANCRHFEMVKHGYEFENIMDTAYLISRCRKKGWQVKEYYLSEPGYTGNLSADDLLNCALWEEWKPRKNAWRNFWRRLRQRLSQFKRR